MVFSLYCTAKLIFVFFFVFYFVLCNHCISVLMLLCFVFRCSIGNIIVTIINYHHFWQPAYCLHFACAH